MAKKTGSAMQVITANDLMTGAVVYLDSDDHWTRDISDARIFNDRDSAQSRVNTAADADNAVVGIDAIGVLVSPENRLEPVHFRERLRLYGPSIDYCNTTNATR